MLTRTAKSLMRFCNVVETSDLKARGCEWRRRKLRLLMCSLGQKGRKRMDAVVGNRSCVMGLL